MPIRIRGGGRLDYKAIARILIKRLEDYKDKAMLYALEALLAYFSLIALTIRLFIAALAA